MRIGRELDLKKRKIEKEKDLIRRRKKESTDLQEKKEGIIAKS